MLTLNLPSRKVWNSDKEEFEFSKEYNFQLEHSLISISKWEAKYRKAFLEQKKFEPEEMYDYIKMMSLNRMPEEAFLLLINDKECMMAISEYINNPMTAVYMSKEEDGASKGKTRDKITSEMVYYWMTVNQIPFTCEKWHINKLMALIHVCGLKNSPPDKNKMSRSDLLKRNNALNAARRQKSGSKG